jgi:hypothetical protein
MGTYVVQQGGRTKGPIRWGLNIFLLLITGGLWIFALPWWPRHKIGGGANAAAIASSSSVINIQAPAPTAAAPVVHATIAAEKDPVDELRKIKALHDEGILTEAEYESQRAALVAQLQPGSAKPGPVAAVEPPQPGQLPPPV